MASDLKFYQQKPSEITQVEEAIAKELARIEREKLSDEKTRQRIRKESPELRELESKLRKAYTAREQLAQIAEKRALYYDRMVEEACFDKQLLDEFGDDKRQLEEEEKVSNEKRDKLRNQLELQLKEQAGARLKAYDEYLKDKAMVDEAVRRVQKEDETAREKIENQKKMAIKDSEELAEIRRRWKQREAEKMRLEEQARTHYVSRKDEEERKAKASAQVRKQANCQLQEKLGEDLLKKEAMRAEMEQIRQTLLLEEEAAKHRVAMEQAREKKMMTQQKLLKDYEMQMQHRQLKQQQLREEESQISRMMQLEYAKAAQELEDEKAKRHEEKLHLAKQIEQDMIEKRRQLEAEYKKTKRELDQQREERLAQERVVEQERRRLLEEHAVHILDYLPKGVFRSSDELEQILEDMGRKAAIQPVEPKTTQ